MFVFGCMSSYFSLCNSPRNVCLCTHFKQLVCSVAVLSLVVSNSPGVLSTDVLDVLHNLDETSKRKVDVLQHFLVHPSLLLRSGQTKIIGVIEWLFYTIILLKVKDRVCFAPIFITYNKLYMYIASICCKTSVTSVLHH